MTLDTDLLKFYGPSNWDSSLSNYGGDISLASLMTSSVSQNEFPNVTNAQRETGLIDYRKQFIRNENADSWVQVCVFLYPNTTSLDDTIDICQAGSYSQLNATVVLGSATFTTATIMQFQFPVIRAVRPGEKIYNITTDPTGANARVISSVSVASTVTILTAFGGATTGTNQIVIRPAIEFTYSAPATTTTALSVGSITGNTYTGLWKRRTVNALASGITNNSVKVRWTTA